NIVEAYRDDLADGVVQQSLLHYTLHYAGSPPGLPEPVMATHMGAMASMRTPEDLTLDDVKTNLYAANAPGVDCYVTVHVDGGLHIERLRHMPYPERPTQAIQALLTDLPSENDWHSE